MIKPKKAFSVLITDDDEQNRMLLVDLLQSITSDVIIQQAENGKAAILSVADKIKQTDSNFDLIFMDFKMPELDGEKATFEIRQIEETTGIHHKSIIITWSTARHSPYPDANDWLIKPPQKQDLKSLLSAYGFIEADS